MRQIITEGEVCLSWKKVAEFQTRMKENIAALCTKFLEGGLARKESRLAALTDVYHRQQLIVTERGTSTEMKSVAGGASGMIKVTWRQVGAGRGEAAIPKCRVDTATRSSAEPAKQNVEGGSW